MPFVAGAAARPSGARSAASSADAGSRGDEPSLVVRLSPGRDAAVTTLLYADWRAQVGASPLLAVASAILDTHSYLLPGGQA